MLCWSLLYNKVNQLYAHIYPCLLGLSPAPPALSPQPPGHHPALSRAPRATQQLLTSPLFYTWERICANPNLPVHSTPLLPLCPRPFSMSASLLLPCREVHHHHFSRVHMCVNMRYLFFSFWFTSLHMTDSRIHVSMNAPDSFLLMAIIFEMKVKVAQLCPDLCNPMDCMQGVYSIPLSFIASNSLSKSWGAPLSFIPQPLAGRLNLRTSAPRHSQRHQRLPSTGPSASMLVTYLGCNDLWLWPKWSL